jgi:hypothetical protein
MYKNIPRLIPVRIFRIQGDKTIIQSSLFEQKLQKLNIFLLRDNVTFLRQFFASLFSHHK